MTRKFSEIMLPVKYSTIVTSGAGYPLDKTYYQTVYATERGSVAAPTAGIHFSNALLDRMKKKGVKMAYITLHIGLGTFRKTRTKPEITDFLSLKEIGSLVSLMKEIRSPPIPILVIGGIRLTDIAPLLEAGVYGIAIASLLNESLDKVATYSKILNAFKN